MYEGGKLMSELLAEVAAEHPLLPMFSNISEVGTVLS